MRDSEERTGPRSSVSRRTRKPRRPFGTGFFGAKSCQLRGRSLSLLPLFRSFRFARLAQGIPNKLMPGRRDFCSASTQRKMFKYTSAPPRGAQANGIFKPPRRSLSTRRADLSPSTMPAQPGRLTMVRRSSARFWRANRLRRRGNCLGAIVGRILWIGVLAGRHFIQRLNTSGGVGATGPYPTAGIERRVEYTAEYIFYK